MKNKSIFINVTADHVDIGYRISYKEEKEGGMHPVYIPGFDIYFSCPSEDEISRRSEAMIKTFMDFWIQENSWKQFFIKLHKLGFRAPLHDLVMKDFLNNKRRQAKFASTNIIESPELFDKEVEHKAHLAY